jgi:hypothetical protein
MDYQVAPPFRSVEFDILFGSGIDKYGCLLDAAESCNVVERKGMRGGGLGSRPATQATNKYSVYALLILITCTSPH